MEGKVSLAIASWGRGYQILIAPADMCFCAIMSILSFLHQLSRQLLLLVYPKIACAW